MCCCQRSSKFLVVLAHLQSTALHPLHHLVCRQQLSWGEAGSYRGTAARSVFHSRLLSGSPVCWLIFSTTEKLWKWNGSQTIEGSVFNSNSSYWTYLQNTDVFHVLPLQFVVDSNWHMIDVFSFFLWFWNTLKIFGWSTEKCVFKNKEVNTDLKPGHVHFWTTITAIEHTDRGFLYA